MDDEIKKAVALWRLGVLGPLISARLEHGDRRAYFEEASARAHVRPDGRIVKLSPRTIEDWYHQHRLGGFEALYPQTRGDQGRSRSIRPGSSPARRTNSSGRRPSCCAIASMPWVVSDKSERACIQGCRALCR